MLKPRQCISRCRAASRRRPSAASAVLGVSGRRDRPSPDDGHLLRSRARSRPPSRSSWRSGLLRLFPLARPLREIGARDRARPRRPGSRRASAISLLDLRAPGAALDLDPAAASAACRFFPPSARPRSASPPTRCCRRARARSCGPRSSRASATSLSRRCSPRSSSSGSSTRLSLLFFLGIALAAGPGGGESGRSPRAACAGPSRPSPPSPSPWRSSPCVWREATERSSSGSSGSCPSGLGRPRVRIAHTFLDGFASLKTPRLAVLVGRGLARHVVRHQRPDLLRDARVRPGPAALGRVRGHDGRRCSASSCRPRRRRRLPRRRAVRPDQRLPRAASPRRRAWRSIAHAISFVPISLVGFASVRREPAAPKRASSL